MLEAKLVEAGLLKRLLEAVKELVTDANFECNEEGIKLQAMDNSHVALVAMHIETRGFQKFRCDRPMTLGVHINSFSKVLKCAKDDDTCTLKASDDADTLSLVYEAKRSGRVADYEMKLMDIDADTLGIPDTEYDARITMASSEFAKLVRDLSSLGESVRVDVSKEGVRFTCEGESANANVLLKHTEDAPVPKPKKIVPKKEEDADEAPSSSKKVKKESKDEDVEMDEDEDDGDKEDKEGSKAGSDGEDEQEPKSDDEEETGKKRKKKVNGKKEEKPSKKAKTSKKKKKDDSDDDSDFDDTAPTGVIIELNSHVSLTFSLKYLVNFAKSTGIANKVQLMLSNEVPLLVSYDFKEGYIRYYLAPKIGDE